MADNTIINNTEHDLEINDFNSFIDIDDTVNIDDFFTDDFNNLEEFNTNSSTNFTNNISTNSVTDTSSIISNVTNYADSFAGGDGSQESPYQIGNSLELARLAYLINVENLDTTDMYFELIDNIDLENFDSDDDSSNGNWIPIGYTTGYPEYLQIGFKGSFNGNNYSISNISIPKIDTVPSGLFGYAKNATFKDLNLNNISIDSGFDSGALIGYGDSNIHLDNINVKDVSINNDGYVGGIIGYMYGELLTIENSSVITSNVLGCKDSSSVGGLVGQCSSYIKLLNNYVSADLSTKSYAGGLIGQINCYNGTPIFIIDNNTVNSVIDLNFQGYEVGGLVGYAYISKLPEEIIISNIKYEGSIINSKASAYNGGVFGYYSGNNSSYTSTLKFSNITVNMEDFNGSYMGGLIGYSYNNNIDCQNINILMNGQVSSSYTFGGLFGMQSSSNYRIDISDYNFKAKNTIKTNYGGGIAGYSYSLISLDSSNLDFNLEPSNNKDSTYFGGLCGYTGGSANDDNFSISKTSILMNTTENSSSSNYVGGYFGYYGFYGKNKPLSVSNSNHVGNLVGDYTGSFIGYGYSDLDLAFKNFYSIGNKSGNLYSSGLINNSNTNININIEDSYFTGVIESENGKTDLINTLENSTLNTINTYYDKTLCELSNDYLIGLTTEQMTGKEAKENLPFDYENIWSLNRDYYPTFNQLNTAPELFGNDIELILNQKYNLLDYIKADDFEDKDLIPEIVTNLDITQIGDYTATFTVTDPQGLSDSLTLKIKVVMESPIINAHDIEIFVNDEFNEKNGVTAIDVDGTDITEYIKVIENTVNTKVAGEYKVIYEIESLYKSPIQKEIKVTVKENPIINDDNDKDDNSNTDKDKDKDKDKDNNKPSKPEDNKNNTNTDKTEKPQTSDNFTLYNILVLVSSTILLSINKKSKKE